MKFAIVVKMIKILKFDLIIVNIPNLVTNDYMSYVVTNGVIIFWLIFINVLTIKIRGHNFKILRNLPKKWFKF